MFAIAENCDFIVQKDSTPPKKKKIANKALAEPRESLDLTFESEGDTDAVDSPSSY